MRRLIWVETGALHWHCVLPTLWCVTSDLRLWFTWHCGNWLGWKWSGSYSWFSSHTMYKSRFEPHQRFVSRDCDSFLICLSVCIIATAIRWKLWISVGRRLIRKMDGSWLTKKCLLYCTEILRSLKPHCFGSLGTFTGWGQRIFLPNIKLSVFWNRKTFLLLALLQTPPFNHSETWTETPFHCNTVCF